MLLDGARVVLVGGAGLVGSHLVEVLLCEPVREVVVFDNFVRGKRESLPKDDRVKVLTGSMTDRPATRAVIDGADAVFLLASLWLGECLLDPRAAWETNVLGSYNVVEACRDLCVKKIVYSSSASVYGTAVEVPMTERHPFNNRTTYGATKIAVEAMLAASGVSHVSLRYMNVYGPRMDRLGAYVSVIMRCLDRIFAGQPPVIHGDGSQILDFVHVSDVARANVLALKYEDVDEVFNIGTGVGTSVSQLVRLLLSVTSSNLTPIYEPGKTGPVSHRVGSIEKAERLLGFKAEVGLREGLERVAEWRLSL